MKKVILGYRFDGPSQQKLVEKDQVHLIGREESAYQVSGSSLHLQLAMF